jgi:phenylpropionate dioxygenase-like ring-hydroxylating dioxygenase large terminal subunit
VEERYGFIWVWTGDKEKADPALIHHLEWADNPEWAYGGGLYHINCDYRLMIDNLMDLTHETYVHATSIGQKEIDEAPVNTRRGRAGHHQPLHGEHHGAAVLARGLLATAWPMMCRSTAGRSAASRRPAM